MEKWALELLMIICIGISTRKDMMLLLMPIINLTSPIRGRLVKD